MVVGRRIAKNSMFLFILTFSNYFIGLLLFPFISRVLSVEMFGLVGFGMAYGAIYQAIVEYGFMISVTAKVSESRFDKNKIGEILSETMLAKLLLLFLSVIIYLILFLFIPAVNEQPLMMGMFFLSGVCASFVPDFYFRGVEKMKLITLRSVVTKLFAVTFIVCVVKDDQDAYIIPLGLFFGNLLAVFWAFSMVLADGIHPKAPSIIRALTLLSDGFLLFLSRITVMLNLGLGSLILGLKFSPASVELGMFTGASKISSAGEMMLTPITDSLYPHMIRSRDYRLFLKVYFFGVAIWFVLCSIVFVFADFFCYMILGPLYENAGDVLRILVVGCFFAFSSNMFGYNALSPIGKVKHANIAIIVSFFVNIITFFILYKMDLLDLLVIALVVSLTNVVIFTYRVVIFFKNIKVIKGFMNYVE